MVVLFCVWNGLTLCLCAYFCAVMFFLMFKGKTAYEYYKKGGARNDEADLYFDSQL